MFFLKMMEFLLAGGVGIFAFTQFVRPLWKGGPILPMLRPRDRRQARLDQAGRELQTAEQRLEAAKRRKEAAEAKEQALQLEAEADAAEHRAATLATQNAETNIQRMLEGNTPFPDEPATDPKSNVPKRERS